MEKKLKEFTKFKLINLLLELCENKKTFNRIKTILQRDLDEISA
jgi:hypothetical protein